jgi:hypothetical protein
MLLDRSFAKAGAVGVSGTLSAVLVGRDGTIASELAIGASAAMALASAARGTGRAGGVAVGLEAG